MENVSPFQTDGPSIHLETDNSQDPNKIIDFDINKIKQDLQNLDKLDYIKKLERNNMQLQALIVKKNTKIREDSNFIKNTITGNLKLKTLMRKAG